MTWTYWPLKFTDQAAANAALYDGELPRYANMQIDVIGIIIHPAVYDDEGEIVTPEITVNGYHVNVAVMGDLPVALEAVRIPFPMQPKRVFFTNTEGVM